MKTKKMLVCKSLALMFLACLLASVVIIMCNTNKAFADPYDSIVDGHVFKHDHNYGPKHDPSWDEECTNAGIRHAYGIRNKQFNECIIKCLNDDNTESEFIFKYNYWGYIGRATENDPFFKDRGPYIQYYYNSETKELVIARNSSWTCPDQDDEYNNDGTYEYPWGIDNIFEVYQTFSDENIDNIKISDEAKYIYIDPDINFIGAHSFRNFYKCEFIDICNHCYKNSFLGHWIGINGSFLQEGCFEDIGEKCEYKTSVPFLASFNSSVRNKILGNDKDKYFGEGQILYNDKYINYFQNFTYNKNEVDIIDPWSRPMKNNTMVTTCKSDNLYRYMFKMKIANTYPAVKVNGQEYPVGYDKESDRFYIELDINKYSRLNVEIIVWNYSCFHGKCVVGLHQEFAIKDVKVELLDADHGNVLDTTKTDENGEYFFNKIPVSVYYVKVRASYQGEVLTSPMMCKDMDYPFYFDVNCYIKGNIYPPDSYVPDPEGNNKLNVALENIEGYVIKEEKLNYSFTDHCFSYNFDTGSQYGCDVSLHISGLGYDFTTDLIKISLANIEKDIRLPQKDKETVTIFGMIYFYDRDWDLTSLHAELIVGKIGEDKDRVVCREDLSDDSSPVAYSFENILPPNKIKIHIYDDCGHDFYTDEYSDITSDSNIDIFPN